MAPKPPKRVVFRWDTAFEWARKNPVLLVGEPGVESDTRKMKIGDGVSGWIELPYFSTDDDTDYEPISDVLLQEHIDDSRPHPAYDNLPSLKLLYENAKV